jgi:two-component sensor histidine kinase
MGNSRLATRGFTTFSRVDGLRSDDIRSVFEGHDGQLYVVTGIHGRYLHRFDGRRFISVSPLVPGHDVSWDWGGWGWGQTHFQDHLGEWWFATWTGLYRYPKVARLEDLAKTPPKAVYTSKDGLAGKDMFRLYEDSRGDIWIAACGGTAGLTQWQRSTGDFHPIEKQQGWDGRIPAAFREDCAGNLWIGLWDHDLVRYRQGRFTTLRFKEGFPDGTILSIWLDRSGRIWAGTTRSGLVRIDEPDAEQIHYRVYSTRDGLSSNNVRSITEDRWGRIYFWTGKGVDRLEPETGGLIHYTTEDGLVAAGSDNQEAFCDSYGNLWFGFIGLSRLNPREESQSPPPLPVYISHLRVQGVPIPVSELGETALSGLVFQPNQNNMQIEFGSLSFETSQSLRFQYKLENTDKDWSPATDLRAVNYANLRPGSYRFSVRVINSRGQVSETPAVMSFQVLSPIWARWWFLMLAGGLLFLLGYVFYRIRLNQLLEVERVRTRIASDLHDDVGSGLSRIAILSELAKREKPGDTGEQLTRIADLSRELVDGMGEIVWAMNPQRDQLGDLQQRMRHFASDVLEVRGIEFSFHTTVADANLPLRSDFRREVYLIFKEAINNSIRHSECTSIEVMLSTANSEFFLQISDNGCGLQKVKEEDGGLGGLGVKNMTKRAATLGGSLEIASRAEGGTQVILRVPLTGKLRNLLKTT